MMAGHKFNDICMQPIYSSGGSILNRHAKPKAPFVMDRNLSERGSKRKIIPLASVIIKNLVIIET